MGTYWRFEGEIKCATTFHKTWVVNIIDPCFRMDWSIRWEHSIKAYGGNKSQVRLGSFECNPESLFCFVYRESTFNHVHSSATLVPTTLIKS